MASYHYYYLRKHLINITFTKFTLICREWYCFATIIVLLYKILQLQVSEYFDI